MLPEIVRHTLEVYLTEKRIPVFSDFHANAIQYTSTKESIFVTLFLAGKIIASSGRIQCKKENTLMETIDNTLLCLSDMRFTENLKNVKELEKIHIRVDHFTPDKRKIIKSPAELDIAQDGLIFLSQPLGKMSILLPKITNVTSNGEQLFDIACKKAGVDRKTLKAGDYILYSIRTTIESDF